jgi:sugar phosphate isomerase/epimerase
MEKFSYVLPDPVSYANWAEFEGDLACLKKAGYDAAELQIADPADLDVPRLSRALEGAGLALCAFQSGGTYASRGNCLSTANETVRARTIQLIRRHIDFAATFTPAVAGHARIVLGSLQGARREEPDYDAGEARIAAALEQVAHYATERGVTVAFEPVCHGEIGWHNTVASVASLVRKIDQPGLKLMVDSFHMNIEERDLLTPLAGVADLLAHVHLSETNRDVLGEGRWPTGGFLRELERVGYAGFCSVGVYNTRRPRRECITRCMSVLKNLHAK